MQYEPIQFFRVLTRNKIWALEANKHFLLITAGFCLFQREKLWQKYNGLQCSLKVARFGNHAWSTKTGCVGQVVLRAAWQQSWSGKCGFGGISASGSLIWFPVEFWVRTQLPGWVLSLPVILPLLFRMREASDGSQSLQMQLERWRQHLWKWLVEQRLCFRGMKSFPLPSTCYMKQVPNGCLMMSGENWWKKTGKN